MSVIAEVIKQYNTFCQLLPPGVTSSVSDFLANLPIIVLFLVTIPIRFFLCIFSSVTKVNLLCVAFNLFPISTLALPFISQQTPQACNTQCPYCVSNNVPCINYFPQILNYYNQCKNQWSILNKIFCLLGVIIAEILNPFLVFINPLIYLAVHKVICLNTDLSICGL